MTAYRITEYDEDQYGHPSFMAEAITPSPLAPLVILVRRPGGYDKGSGKSAWHEAETENHGLRAIGALMAVKLSG